MKNRDEVKKAILEALGNPTTGVFVDYIDTIVDAVVGKEAKATRPNDAGGSVQGENKAASQPAKETRVIEASDKR